MPTVLEDLKERLKRRRESHGPSDPVVKSLKVQIEASEMAGETAHDLWVSGPLSNPSRQHRSSPPTDLAQAE